MPKKTPADRSPSPNQSSALSWAIQLGVLRWSLAILALMCIVFMPPAGTTPIYAGWELFRTVLVPVIAPMVLAVLLLDALMARIFMSELEGSARQRYRRIITVDLVVAVTLVLFSLPFYLAINA